MPRPIRLTLIVAAGVAALISLVLLAVGSTERHFVAAVEAIEVGMPHGVVMERLGKPGYEGTDCYIAQTIKFEKPSQRSPAEYCAHWMGPSFMFQFYAVGFSIDHKVVWVAYGDS
jgi:hypothetical protein